MRRRLMFNGLIAVTIVLNSNGLIETQPRILVRGVPGTEDANFESDATSQLDRELRALPHTRRADDDAIDDLVRRTVRRLLKPLTYGRPPIEVDIIRLDAI